MSKSKTKQPPCVICKKPIDIQPSGWAGGHNAEPVKSGRCCTQCQQDIVLPLRIAGQFSDAAMRFLGDINNK